MKKLLALFLSLLLAAALIPAAAETATEEPATAEDGQSSDDWSMLLALLTQNGEGAEGGDEMDLSALLGFFGVDENANTTGSESAEEIIDMLLAAAGTDETGLTATLGFMLLTYASPIETPADAVPAESKEAFFGTWKLLKAVKDGRDTPAESMGQNAQALAITLGEDTIAMNIDAEKNTAAAVTLLSDGALTVMVNDAALTVYLMGDGTLAFGFNGSTVFLTPGTADTLLKVPDASEEEAELADMITSLLGSLGLSGEGEEGQAGSVRSIVDSLFGGEGEEGSLDLSGILGSLGGLFGGEGEEGSVDLSGILGSLGSLFGGEGEEGSLDLSGILGSLTGGEGEEGSVDLSGILGSLGSLFGGEGEEGSLDLSGILGSLTGGEGEEGSLDLSGILGSLGSLTGGEGEEGSLDLSSLLGLFGGEEAESAGVPDPNNTAEGQTEGAGENAAAPEEGESQAAPLDKPENAVAAESKEQFFGAWKTYYSIVSGEIIPADKMEKNWIIVISEDFLYRTDGVTEDTLSVETELIDGALVAATADEMYVFYLLDDGTLMTGDSDTIICLAFVPVE
ncbi:MAG: hypothetical protein IKQ41_12725 [Clostridia bacterium]|nr:hypothetical protein [Clostridia bacterium]